MRHLVARLPLSSCYGINRPRSTMTGSNKQRFTMLHDDFRLRSNLIVQNLVNSLAFRHFNLKPWNVCWFWHLPQKANIKKLQQKLLQLQVRGRTQKPKHHQTPHQDQLKQSASNSLEAVVGLPSSTSLSMGAGRGIFPLWRSGWTLHWPRARKLLEPQSMSLDEWELAEEQYFLMQGLFLVHVPTSCRSFFKARFGSCGVTSLQLIQTRIVGTARHELPFIHTVLIVDSREKAWYLVTMENKKRAGCSIACMAFSSNASNAMEPLSVTTTDSYFNLGRNVKRKIRKCSIIYKWAINDFVMTYISAKWMAPRWQHFWSLSLQMWVSWI